MLRASESKKANPNDYFKCPYLSPSLTASAHCLCSLGALSPPLPPTPKPSSYRCACQHERGSRSVRKSRKEESALIKKKMAERRERRAVTYRVDRVLYEILVELDVVEEADDGTSTELEVACWIGNDQLCERSLRESELGHSPVSSPRLISSPSSLVMQMDPTIIAPIQTCIDSPKMGLAERRGKGKISLGARRKRARRAHLVMLPTVLLFSP